MSTAFLSGCQDDLIDKNENPNGVSPDNVHPNLMLATVLTQSSKNVVSLGFGNIAGVMQHTQKNGWAGGHNNYDWSNQSWTGYYNILRDNNVMYERAVAMELPFHQGVALVMRAYNFGMITDLWGDAPYTNALNASKGGNENLLPAFDTQDVIYEGILADLEMANTVLAIDAGSAQDENIYGTDVIYGGDPLQWRMFANSLQLRYYMRISGKEPAMAQAGIEKIVGNPEQYPIISSIENDATMSYVGNSSDDAWPSNSVFDLGGSQYTRIQMCETLVDALQTRNDPRIAVWAEKVDVPLVVSDTLPAETNTIIDGIRYISPDQIPPGIPYNTDPEYVGLPPAVGNIPAGYNLNAGAGQGSANPHVSAISAMYRDATGPMLLARLASAAEVHFVLAEAALNGWAVGDAQTHYNAGVQASLETWGVGDQYEAYLAGSASFDGTLEQLITQKWIASWTAATEAWFDYRRTGFPALEAGEAARRSALPLRFYYMQDELTVNESNAMEAVNRLEETAFTSPDGKNSAWSKPWVLQGTGEPY
ncbi:SusD/RagB family nutrient-binding outer membrane lipoprotein [Tunicatimonas pelagia]|uniref:SusD/RagB family nutrient-binding outer membrane lipoprotein n=1 Tax=Tunicatimonas pelagia TaxID=931531 RepID=UPI002666F34A|nr:SusD/RagB family nutrient-binding outer membrane lipoprotein [Tunicatimonas pelagia]WKN42082.1 SusD/RagB family nutrient-binding outer membrane lipoprotein [Tunicatimonas pelagia]